METWVKSSRRQLSPGFRRHRQAKTFASEPEFWAKRQMFYDVLLRSVGVHATLDLGEGSLPFVTS